MIKIIQSRSISYSGTRSDALNVFLTFLHFSCGGRWVTKRFDKSSNNEYSTPPKKNEHLYTHTTHKHVQGVLYSRLNISDVRKRLVTFEKLRI